MTKRRTRSNAPFARGTTLAIRSAAFAAVTLAAFAIAAGTRSGAFTRSRPGLAEMTARLCFAAPAGFFLAAMTLVFLALADFGGLALFLAAYFLGGAANGFLGRALAILRLTDAGIGKRTRPRIHFFI